MRQPDAPSDVRVYRAKRQRRVFRHAYTFRPLPGTLETVEDQVEPEPELVAQSLTEHSPRRGVSTFHESAFILLHRAEVVDASGGSVTYRTDERSQESRAAQTGATPVPITDVATEADAVIVTMPEKNISQLPAGLRSPPSKHSRHRHRPLRPEPQRSGG